MTNTAIFLRRRQAISGETSCAENRGTFAQSIRDGDRLIAHRRRTDHFCAQSVRRDLDALLLDRSIRTLILDFSSLTFMDSSGIGVVLGRYRLLRDRGGHVAIVGMNPHIARLFHMSGLDRIIRQLDKHQEAQA
ncbi:MAG: anti-sigma factor antagonist [Christensenellales bacterium]